MIFSIISRSIHAPCAIPYSDRSIFSAQLLQRQSVPAGRFRKRSGDLVDLAISHRPEALPAVLIDIDKADDTTPGLCVERFAHPFELFDMPGNRMGLVDKDRVVSPDDALRSDPVGKLGRSRSAHSDREVRARYPGHRV